MRYSQITNAKIITGNAVVYGSMDIDAQGMISAITPDGHSRIKDASYDAGGAYVIPGLIETHGHFREPGMEHKEDIMHGTRAALAGGFTTVFDMPNTKPPITTVDLVHEQARRYAEKSYCDFAINMGTSVEDISELENIDPADITGVKVFTAGHQTTPTTIPDLADQARIWEIAARRGFPIMVHAENQQLVTYRENIYREAGRTDMLAYSEARNESVVEMAAWESVMLAKTYGTSLWLLHASSEGEFDAISYARKCGVHAGGEVTGYQLFFTTSDYGKLGTRIKVCPALRTPEVNKKLWRMVRKGVVDGICSEHTPHALEEKNTDVWSAVSGTPGIQETVAVFITGWLREFGETSLEEGLITIARCSSVNVANFFGYHRKSGIAVGNDADCVVLDTDHSWHVAKEDLFTKLRWSAYEGLELTGRPQATFLRGQLVYEKGKIVNQTPSGKWLRKRS